MRIFRASPASFTEPPGLAMTRRAGPFSKLLLSMTPCRVRRLARDACQNNPSSMKCRNCVNRGHIRIVFTARRYASAVYGVIACLSVRLSQVGVLQRWLNVGSHKQRQRTRTSFLTPKISVKFQRGHLNEAQNKGGVGSDRRLSTNISLYLRNGAR